MKIEQNEKRMQVCVRLEPKVFELIRTKAIETKTTLSAVARELIKKAIQG